MVKPHDKSSLQIFVLKLKKIKLQHKLHGVSNIAYQSAIKNKLTNSAGKLTQFLTVFNSKKVSVFLSGFLYMYVGLYIIHLLTKVGKSINESRKYLSTMSNYQKNTSTKSLTSLHVDIVYNADAIEPQIFTGQYP